MGTKSGLSSLLRCLAVLISKDREAPLIVSRENTRFARFLATAYNLWSGFLAVTEAEFILEDSLLPVCFVRRYSDPSVGQLRNAGINGNWWSSRGADNVWGSAGLGAYNLNFNATGVNLSNGPINRWNGFPLRCLSRVRGSVPIFFMAMLRLDYECTP